MDTRTTQPQPQPDSQPDLFSWCSAHEPEEVVDSHLPPLEDLAADWLPRILREPSTGYARADAVREVVRRRLPEAGALLIEVCQRNLGFDRVRPVPEVAAAIDGMAAMGVASAAPAVASWIREDRLGDDAVRAALRFFLAVRHDPGSDFLLGVLARPDSGMATDACRLAAISRPTPDVTMALENKLFDRRPDVAEAALLALGHLGVERIKGRLESRLGVADATAVADIAEALGVIGDDQTVILIGRRLREVSEPDACRMVMAIELIGGQMAEVWLKRMAQDERAEVRRLAEELTHEN